MVDINILISNPSFFENISELDIDKITTDILPILKPKIISTARRTINGITNGNIELPIAAFEERAKIAIKNAVTTYITTKRWRSNIPIAPYLTVVINRLGKILDDENTCRTNKVTKYICPACKEFKIKEYLDVEGDFFVCKVCTKQIEELENELKLLV